MVTICFYYASTIPEDGEDRLYRYTKYNGGVLVTSAIFCDPILLPKVDR